MSNQLPGETLVSILNQLRQRLIRSGVERTNGIKDAMGTNCPYYRKSMNVFLARDYQELRDLIETAHDLFIKCEEDNNG